MKNRRFSRLLIAFISLFCTLTAHAAEPSLGFVGRDDWLFYRVEYSDVSDQAATDTSIELIRRFNKVLSRNGITMAFTMVPLKARIYAEHLPNDARINSYMADNYEHMAQRLRAAQVNLINLNSPFLNSPKRNTEFPLYFRLDTHMSPAGTMLTAEIIRAEIDANPILKRALDSVPEEPFVMAWGKNKVNSPSRGLVGLLPAGSATFAEEQMLPFLVFKKQDTAGSLLGDGSDAEITLMGSSYSAAHYRLPAALRYTLQRDILDISVEAIQGSWVGMESYLRDTSFQTRRPKLLIWEMPERDMRMPPDYQYRDIRYHSDNTEWLLRAAAWVQNSCTPSSVTARVVTNSLVPHPTDTIETGNTTDKDFIELSFNKPIEQLDYLVAKITANGSKKIILEASGAGTETRWFNVQVPGDGSDYLLKTPLPSHGNRFTKLRIFPGKNSSFTLKDFQVCRQIEDLLK
jgi:alginate O-acetyltransferase complex protein AlgJ